MTFQGFETKTYGKFKNRQMIVDSGTSYIMIPRHDLEIFLYYLEAHTGMECEMGEKVPTCICSESQYYNIPNL